MNLLELKSKITPLLFRAPSFFNAQPYRIRFHDDEIFVIEDTERILTQLDPQEKYHELGVGMFVETLSIVLSSFGLKISKISYHKESLVSMRIRAKIKVEPTDTVDPLFKVLPLRRSYRGKFSNLEPSQEKKYLSDLKKIPGVQILAQGQFKATWARMYDSSLLSLLGEKATFEEFFHWVRFSSQHPRSDLDGLNADALGLNWFKARLADTLLLPHRFELIKKLGFPQGLISEASSIESALALITVTSDANLSLFDQGRSLFRIWLEVTKLGLNMAMMPALAESETSRKKVIATLPAGQTLVTVFRVGKTNQEKVPLSPRLKSIEA